MPPDTAITPPTYRAILIQLASAQKGRAAGAPAYSVYVNRPLGRRLAAAAHTVGMSPDAVTVVSGVVTLSGILVLASVPPVWWVGPLVWALLALGYALDSADGQVARLRGGGTLRGEWLDHVLDAFKSVALHAAVLVAAFRFYELPGEAWLLTPLGFAVVAPTTFVAIILKDLLADQAPSRHPTGSAGLLRSIIALPTDYGFICLIFLLAGVPGLFMPAYTALFFVNVAFLVLGCTRWYSTLRDAEHR